MTTACAPPLSTLPAWCDLVTRAGRFTLSPVRPDRDLPLLHRWLNDPVVDEYWRLGGEPARVAEYLGEVRARSHSRGFVGRLSGRAIGYWEVYRAVEDRLGRYYLARPSDLGVRLLIGEADCRGLGLGPVLLDALVRALQQESRCRVVAAPDERDSASLRAFAHTGFRRAGTLALPERNAALMMREAAVPGPMVPRPLVSETTTGIPPGPRQPTIGLMTHVR